VAPNRFPDFSEFQGAVDWSALGAAFATGQLDAVAIRAGFGTVRADAQFATNQQEARARGIPVVYYWFTYPAYNTPGAEAAMFNATVGPLGPGEAMAGDFEDDPGALPFPRGAVGLQWCRDFLAALRAPQSATWWYSYPYLISSVGLRSLVDTWPLWEADYSATPDSSFAPAIARQFTDCGTTPGIAGCCDQSRVLRAPLEQWLKPAAIEPTQPTGEADGMGFLSRDVTGETIDEVYASGGEALWGSYPGGAGEWISATTAPTNLGSPVGAKDLVEVTGAFTTHAGVQRLNLRGVRKDGSRWVKVMNPADFSVLEDWTEATAGPAQDVPLGTETATAIASLKMLVTTAQDDATKALTDLRAIRDGIQ
jgi:GH25 family lysozyme M1 (1,4-beta-N-acetylmuramidase)